VSLCYVRGRYEMSAVSGRMPMIPKPASPEVRDR
jgi:hypothetical protein